MKQKTSSPKAAKGETWWLYILHFCLTGEDKLFHSLCMRVCAQCQLYSGGLGEGPTCQINTHYASIIYPASREDTQCHHVSLWELYFLSNSLCSTEKIHLPQASLNFSWESRSWVLTCHNITTPRRLMPEQHQIKWAIIMFIIYTYQW